MIAIFKTNINSLVGANKIISKLLTIHPTFIISVDLEDEDRILRVEGDDFEITEICMLIERNHFICIHLPVDLTSWSPD